LENVNPVKSRTDNRKSGTDKKEKGQKKEPIAKGNQVGQAGGRKESPGEKATRGSLVRWGELDGKERQRGTGNPSLN